MNKKFKILNVLCLQQVGLPPYENEIKESWNNSIPLDDVFDFTGEKMTTSDAIF